MKPSTVAVATGTSDARIDYLAPTIARAEPAALLADLLDELDHGLTPEDAAALLARCLSDLAGYPATALPELAFRLMRQRVAALQGIS